MVVNVTNIGSLNVSEAKKAPVQRPTLQERHDRLLKEILLSVVEKEWSSTQGKEGGK